MLTWLRSVFSSIDAMFMWILFAPGHVTAETLVIPSVIKVIYSPAFFVAGGRYVHAMTQRCVLFLDFRFVD